MKRSHYIALGLVVLLTLVLLNLPGHAAARFKLALSSLFLPLFGLASSSQQWLGRGADALTPRKELIREIQQLRRDNQELRILNLQGIEAARENDRLRDLLGWQKRSPWKLKSARVVLHDPANFWRTIQIDLGTRNGLSNNLPVLAPDGSLVGRIASAGLTRSQVLLLGDPNCKVAATVENEKRDQGILASAGALDSDLVELSFSGRSADIKPGQAVVTSGLGGVFPKGIPIGRIVDSRLVEYGLYLQARVKLAASLSGIEEVWVVWP